MPTNLQRVAVRGVTDAGWVVLRDGAAVLVTAEPASTAEVLTQHVEQARELLADPSAPTLDAADVTVLSPVTRPCQIVAQGANYRSHAKDNGGTDTPAFNMLFRKASASLSGPTDDVVRPAHVRLLDYEVELGIVLGRPLTEPTTVTDADLGSWIGALVVANDVSARDVQLPQTQFYKGKSYRTFCPVGPRLTVLDPPEVVRLRELRLTLSVNGELRQDGTVDEMFFDPAAALTEISQLEELAVGDLLLTGTPGGCALQPPPALVQKLSGLLPEPRKWAAFVRTQTRSGRYLEPGDVVTASIATRDGAIDLGVQRTVIVQG